MGILKTINLEIGRPTVEEAIKKFEFELKNAVKSNISCFLFIHGYGSHGKGGLIREELREEIKSLKNQNKIKCYVFGEDFKILNNDANRLRHKYDDLERLFHMTNKGVTVVEI